MPARKYPSQPSCAGLPMPPVPPPRAALRACPPLPPLLEPLLRIGKERVIVSARADECASFMAWLIEPKD